MVARPCYTAPHQGGVCIVNNAQFSRPSSLLHRVMQTGCVLLLCSIARADTVADVRAQIDGGQFAAAETRIAAALAQPALSPTDRDALAFERERMRRILLDFTLTADQAQAKLRKQIPDLTPAEFAAWDAQGLLEHMTIDGRLRYFSRAPSNLFRL